MKLNDALTSKERSSNMSEEQRIKSKVDFEQSAEMGIYNMNPDSVHLDTSGSSISPITQLKAIDAITNLADGKISPDTHTPADKEILKIMFDGNYDNTSEFLEKLNEATDDNGIKYAYYQYYYDDLMQVLQPQTLVYGPFSINLPVTTEEGWEQVRKLEEFKEQQNVILGGRQAELEARGGYDLVNQEILRVQGNPQLQLENKIRYKKQQELAQEAYQKMQNEMVRLGDKIKQEHTETKVQQTFSDNLGNLMISIEDIFEDRDPGDYIPKMMLTGVSPEEMYGMLGEDEVVKINTITAYFKAEIPHERLHLVDERLDHSENVLTEEEWTALEHAYNVCYKLIECDNDIWSRLTSEQQDAIEEEYYRLEDSFEIPNLSKAGYVARMRNWNVTMVPVRELLESEGKIKVEHVLEPAMIQIQDNLGGNNMATQKVVLAGATNQQGPKVYAAMPTLNLGVVGGQQTTQQQAPQIIMPQLSPQLAQQIQQVQPQTVQQPVQMVQPQVQMVQQPQQVVMPQLAQQVQQVQPQTVQQVQPVQLVQPGQPVRLVQPQQVVQQPQQVVMPQLAQQTVQPQLVQPTIQQSMNRVAIGGVAPGLNKVNWQQMEDLLSVLWNNRQFVASMSDATYTTAWKDCCSAVHKKDATGLADIVRGLQVMTQNDGSAIFIDSTIFTRMLGELNPHVPTDGIKYSTDYSVYRNITVQPQTQQMNTVRVQTQYPNLNTVAPMPAPIVPQQANATQYTNNVQYAAAPTVSVQPPAPPQAQVAAGGLAGHQVANSVNMVTLPNGVKIPARI